MTLHLPTFVFLFDPQSDDDTRTRTATLIAAQSFHLVLNITDPLKDAAVSLGLRPDDIEEQLRMRWPGLLGLAHRQMITDNYDPSPCIFTHCSYVEDVHIFTAAFTAEECLAVNFGPIWAIPPRCSTCLLYTSDAADERSS